jgi:hypothetical protein
MKLPKAGPPRRDARGGHRPLGGDWEADIAAYDQIHEDILAMVDVLAEGIVAHFPERF